MADPISKNNATAGKALTDDDIQGNY
jgi:hypothetical protein